MFLSRYKLPAERTYYIMSGAQTLFDSTMFVFLTVFYFTVIGLNPLQLVLVGTVLEASILIFEVPTGVVADTYSRRLSLILGILILGAGFVITGLARSFSLVLIAQAICGLGYTFTSGATEAWLADEVGEEKVGAVFVRSGQINRLLGILGILVSAVLASMRLDLPILVGGVLYMGLGLWLVLVMPERNFHPLPREGAQSGMYHMLATFREGSRIVRARPALIGLVLIELFVGLSSEGFDRLGDAHLVANFPFPTLVLPVLGTLNPLVWFSLLNLIGALLSLLVIERLRLPLERLTRDLRQTSLALVFLNLVFVGAGIGFALAGSFTMAAFCAVLRGQAGALIWPLYGAYRVQSVPARVRATILSMTGQGNALGQVVGGPLVGWIGTGSLRAALVVAGLMLLPNSLLYGRTAVAGPSERDLGDADLAPGEALAPELQPEGD